MSPNQMSINVISVEVGYTFQIRVSPNYLSIELNNQEVGYTLSRFNISAYWYLFEYGIYRVLPLAVPIILRMALVKGNLNLRVTNHPDTMVNM